MRFFILPLILVLSACSLDKNSTYWYNDPIKKTTETKKPSKVLNKTADIETMTFDEFNLFLKDYSEEAGYPDIN